MVLSDQDFFVSLSVLSLTKSLFYSIVIIQSSHWPTQSLYAQPQASTAAAVEHSQLLATCQNDHPSKKTLRHFQRASSQL